MYVYLYCEHDLFKTAEFQANLHNTYQPESLQKRCGCSTYMCLQECVLDRH